MRIDTPTDTPTPSVIYKKHYDAIFEIDMGADVSNDKARWNAAKKSELITREMMVKFAEWIADVGLIRNSAVGNMWLYNSEDAIANSNWVSTNKILDLFLQSLNTNTESK